ncbi:MAG: T9SS type A sorting domain-containing protein [Bacteroidales bacterium]|nr:T9SS type A sorting domain-containing protein [Bacteroidales bacterium]
MTLQAQESLILSGFIGKASDEKVLLQWTISSGQTCNGTFIQRSEDTIHFETIGEISGICGSSESPVPYSFSDEDPIKNKVNFYRLELGGQGYSRIIAIPYFEYGNMGSIVIPNPVTSQTRIYFENKTEKPYLFSLFNYSGNLIRQSKGNDSFVFLDASNLSAGAYLYSIQLPDRKPITGKVIISH